MAPDPKQPPSDKEKMMRVLIPAGAIAFIVVLVALLVSVFETDKPGEPRKLKSGKHAPPPTGGNDVSKLTDGTAPNADDANLRDIGDGLKIRDLKVGDGDEVKPGQTVVAYYTGWLTSGKVFDSSRRDGKPIPFSLDGVVKGWSRGIPGMKVGGIRKLVIPPELGYGARGAGSDIPPNATLIFEVEVVDAQ